MQLTPDDNSSSLEKINPENSVVSSVAFGSSESRRGCVGAAFLGAGGCLMLLLVGLSIPVILGITTFNNILNNLQSVFTENVNSPSVAEVYSTQTLLSNIQPLGQLISVSVELAKADIDVSIQQGALDACSYSANHVAQGAIEAGIDLMLIGEEDIQDAGDILRITLPAPELLSCRVDYIRQYERSFTGCSVDWDEARLLAQYIALTEFRDDAVEAGILQRAEREANTVIGTFLTFVTGRTVEIEFSPVASSSSRFPESCNPQPPDGWAFDETLNSWVKE